MYQVKRSNGRGKRGQVLNGDLEGLSTEFYGPFMTTATAMTMKKKVVRLEYLRVRIALRPCGPVPPYSWLQYAL